MDLEQDAWMAVYGRWGGAGNGLGNGTGNGIITLSSKLILVVLMYYMSIIIVTMHITRFI
jgi:hypothetical protein